MEEDVARGQGDRYNRGAMAIHWIIAILIALNFVGGWAAGDLPDAEKAQALAGHKAMGLVILMLTGLRLVWRLFHAPPPLVESLKAWEAALAKVVHVLILMLTVALPLAGWALHSAYTGGGPVSIFGLFAIPGLPLAQDKASAALFRELHELFGTLLFILLALHIAAALKHQFADKDGTMRRIVPWGK